MDRKETHKPIIAKDNETRRPSDMVTQIHPKILTNILTFEARHNEITSPKLDIDKPRPIQHTTVSRTRARSREFCDDD